MDFFNTSFYDKESSLYSGKRYGSIPQSYIQFFFQKRLAHVLKLIGKYRGSVENAVLIEDGCADGIVIRKVAEIYGNNFSRLIGTDISPKMIEQATTLTIDPRVSFTVKAELSRDIKADYLLAVGFVSPGIFSDEFNFIREHVKQDGIVIMSLVANNSPYAKLKLNTREITKDYWTYKQYEEFLKKDFEIIDRVPYGLFIPKLWAFPTLARVLQPIFETLFTWIPTLFHETLYVLKYKR